MKCPKCLCQSTHPALTVNAALQPGSLHRSIDTIASKQHSCCEEIELVANACAAIAIAAAAQAETAPHQVLLHTPTFVRDCLQRSTSG